MAAPCSPRDGVLAGAEWASCLPLSSIVRAKACRLTHRRSVYTLRLCGFSWDEKKRRLNLKEHGLDFVDAPRVFEGPTFTFEDDRFAHDEQRFVTLGFLAGMVVSMVHTESPSRIHVISFRKATRNEEAILFKNLQD